MLPILCDFFPLTDACSYFFQTPFCHPRYCVRNHPFHFMYYSPKCFNLPLCTVPILLYYVPYMLTRRRPVTHEWLFSRPSCGLSVKLTLTRNSWMILHLKPVGIFSVSSQRHPFKCFSYFNHCLIDKTVLRAPAQTVSVMLSRDQTLTTLASGIWCVARCQIRRYIFLSERAFHVGYVRIVFLSLYVFASFLSLLRFALLHVSDFSRLFV